MCSFQEVQWLQDTLLPELQRLLQVQRKKRLEDTSG